MTGVPFAKAKFINDVATKRAIHLAEGLLGATNMIRTVEGVVSGGTPELDQDAGGSQTVIHATAGSSTDTGHTGIVVTDILEHTTVSNDDQMIIAGFDATDAYVERLDTPGTSTGDIFGIATDISNKSVPLLLAKGDDGKIYGTQFNSNQSALYSVTANIATYTAAVFTLPLTLVATALGKFQTFFAIGWNSTFPGDFDQRNVAGQSGIILWDYIEATLFERNIICPANYISAIVQAPDGNVIVFGGVNQGKTTIYSFTGYGFTALFSYIGDMPRSRHAIDFDSMGRLNWLTADGQWLRLNLQTGAFSHLGSITTGSKAGGVLTSLLGATGNDFLVASGTGSTYTLKRGIFGSYIGDGAGSDTVNTPLAVSSLVRLPARSMLEFVDINLHSSLVSGEKIEVRLYKDGSTTYSVLGSLSFATDGAIGAKRIYLRKYGIDSLAIGLAWKMADAAAAAPAILPEVNLSYRRLR